VVGKNLFYLAAALAGRQLTMVAVMLQLLNSTDSIRPPSGGWFKNEASETYRGTSNEQINVSAILYGYLIRDCRIRAARLEMLFELQ
jgi:hypothetical protein